MRWSEGHYEHLGTTEREIARTLDESPQYRKRHGDFAYSDVVDAAKQMGLRRPEDWADRLLYGTD